VVGYGLDLELRADGTRQVEARVRQRDVRSLEVDRICRRTVVGVELAGHRNTVAAWCNSQMHVCFQIGCSFEIAARLNGPGDHAVIAEILMQEHAGQLRDVEVREPAVDMETLSILYAGIAGKRTSKSGELQVSNLSSV